MSIGHPIGASGARVLVTFIYEMMGAMFIKALRRCAWAGQRGGSSGGAGLGTSLSSFFDQYSDLFRKRLALSEQGEDILPILFVLFPKRRFNHTVEINTDRLSPGFISFEEHDPAVNVFYTPSFGRTRSGTEHPVAPVIAALRLIAFSASRYEICDLSNVSSGLFLTNNRSEMIPFRMWIAAICAANFVRTHFQHGKCFKFILW